MRQAVDRIYHSAPFDSDNDREPFLFDPCKTPVVNQS